MIREATAVWRRGPMGCEGRVTCPSGELSSLIYTVSATAVNGMYTSIVEILAAAEAASISNVLVIEMERLGMTPDEINVTASLTLQGLPEWKITDVHLKLHIRMAEIDPEKLLSAVKLASATCPVTKLLNIVPTVESSVEATHKAAATAA